MEQEEAVQQKPSRKKLSKKKKICIAGIILLAVAALIIWYGMKKKKLDDQSIPTLSILTPAKQSIADKNEFTVDVALSALGDDLYPAASLSIVFDAAHLEFTGVTEGDIMILGDTRADGNSNQPVDWSVDIARSNDTGQINIMYLDMTGGQYAFSGACMEEDDSVLLRLSFRLRGSAKKGDIYDLSFADAVFAASDESKSLASTKGTLNTESGKVVVKE